MIGVAPCRAARWSPLIAALLLAVLASAGYGQDAANKNPPADGSVPPSSAPPNRAKRAALFIVGSSVVGPFADWAVKEMQKQYELPDAVEQLEGTVAGFEKFCAGVGKQYPDIVGASRPMRKSEFDECVTNGVLDIIEIRIGESAIAIVTKKGNPVFNVTPRMLYLALAAEVPRDGEFKRNDAKAWNDVTRDKKVPALPIKLLLPSPATGLHITFNDRILQGGCRHLPEIDSIFAADERVQKCITLRRDVVEPLDEPLEQTTMAAIKNTAPGTLAVTDLLIYKKHTDALDLMPLAGVIPDHNSIDNYSYMAVTPLIFYVKRQHMLNNKGKGVVRGLREFMQAVTSDAAFAPDGAFAQMGLEPWDAEEIAEIRKNVRLMRRYER